MSRAAAEGVGYFAQVRKPGPLTTVQDLGRTGHVSSGVPLGGAMDPLGAGWANRVVGNAPAAAMLEVTLNQVELQILQASCVICVAGPASVEIDGVGAETYRPLELKAGSRITLRPGRVGARSYLAFQGGLAIPTILGSKSTYLPGRFGGLEGRALVGGDLLRLARERVTSVDEKARSTVLKYLEAQERNILRFIPSGRSGRLAQGLPWKVAPMSDRMGVRFNPLGKKFTRPPALRFSQGAFFGLIQLPPDGSVICLGADAQTIGGYPIAGGVISADLWKLAQLLPGDSVEFKPVSANRAVALWREQSAL